jgi:hypothetical protein
MISFTLCPCYTQKKSVRSTFEEKAGWGPEPMGALWSRENLLFLLGIEPRFLGPSACIPIALYSMCGTSLAQRICALKGGSLSTFLWNAPGPNFHVVFLANLLFRRRKIVRKECSNLTVLLLK